MSFHSCLFEDNGDVIVWGSGDAGQLGMGEHNLLTPTKLMNLDKIKGIACGSYFTIILDHDHELFGFGENIYGQLGIGNNINITNPTFITNEVLNVSCGGHFALFLKKDRSLYGMGRNDYGQLGIGNFEDRNSPEFITSHVSMFACGGYHSVVMKNDGCVYTCGRNEEHQLGFTKVENHKRLTYLLRDREIFWISCGRWHTILVKKHDLIGFGWNAYGQLMCDEYAKKVETPKIIWTSLNQEFKIVQSGGSHTLVLMENGDLYSCGRNIFGQLGHSHTKNLFNPELVMKDVDMVSAGSTHTMATKIEGNEEIFFACGGNKFGQLGTGDKLDISFMKPIIHSKRKMFLQNNYNHNMDTEGEEEEEITEEVEEKGEEEEVQRKLEQKQHKEETYKEEDIQKKEEETSKVQEKKHPTIFINNQKIPDDHEFELNNKKKIPRVGSTLSFQKKIFKNSTLSSTSISNILFKQPSSKPRSYSLVPKDQNRKPFSFQKEIFEEKSNEEIRDKFFKLQKLYESQKNERMDKYKNKGNLVIDLSDNLDSSFYCISCLKVLNDPQYCASGCFKNVCKSCVLFDDICPHCRGGKVTENSKLKEKIENVIKEKNINTNNNSFKNFNFLGEKIDGDHKIIINSTPKEIHCKGAQLGCGFKTTSKNDLYMHQIDCSFSLHYDKNNLKEYILFLLSQFDQLESEFTF